MRRRTILASSVLAMTAVIVMGGVGAAWGAFNNSVTGSNSVTTRLLVAPSSLTAAASGHDVALSWPAGQSGNGYSVLGAANGTSSNCSSTSLTALTSTAGLTTTDTGRYSPQGSWFCYQVKTTYGSWTSVSANPIAAAQLGFVISSVAMTNAANTTGCAAGTFGVSGVLDCGDQFVVTFSQPVNTVTAAIATDNVCADQTVKTIYLAASGLGQCSNSESFDVAKLTMSTGGLHKSRYAATFTWANNNTVLTIRIGAFTFGSTYANVSTSDLVTPTTNPLSLLSNTGAFNICSANAGVGDNCLPTTTGSV